MRRKGMHVSDNKPEIVAEVRLPALKQQVFGAFVANEHDRGLRLIAGKKRLDLDGGVTEAERIIQQGIREMLANGAPPPQFRNGFGKPMGKAVIAMPARVRTKGAAA